MLRSLTLALLMAVPALGIAQDKKPEKADDKKPEKAEKFDAAKLVGDWKITDGMKAGEKIADDAGKGAVTITKDKISLKSMDMSFVFAYKIDDKKDPVALSPVRVCHRDCKGDDQTKHVDAESERQDHVPA